MISVKKILFFVIVTLLAVLLTSCDPEPYRFNLNHIIEEAYSIELVDYDNNNAKELNQNDKKTYELTESDFLNINFNNLSVIEILAKEKQEDFLKQILNNDFFLYDYYEKHYDSPNGYAIKINYKNNNFEIICVGNNYVGNYISDGTVNGFGIYMNDVSIVVTIINSYFSTNISI